MSWIFKEKGTYLGRVEDPTTAKFAPLLKLFPAKESRYGLKRLAFKLWPAQKRHIYYNANAMHIFGPMSQ